MSPQPPGRPSGATASAASSMIVQGVSSITTSMVATPASATSFPHDRPSSLPQPGPPGGSGFKNTPLGNAKVSAELDHMFIGVSAMFLVLCLAAVLGRLWARRMARVGFEADDWMVIVALAMLVTLCIEQFLLAHFIAMVPPESPPSTGLIHDLSQTEIASQITYDLLITSARLSVLLLYRRIFSLAQRGFGITWWFCTALTVVYCFTLLGILLGHVESATPTIVIGFWNIGLDLSIWMLPWRMVWNLHLSWRRKVGVCAMFALGLIGVAVSVGRATSMIHMKSFTGRDGMDFACWSIAEAAVALLCANLPLLRPLISSAYSKLSTARNKSTSPELDSLALKRTQPTYQKEKDTISISSTQAPLSPVWGLESARRQSEPHGMV